MVLDLNLLIVIAYLIFIILIGVYSGRDVKNISEYAVYHRSYSAFIIFATLSASFIGGGFTIGNAEKVYLFGIASSLVLWGFSLKEILVARYIAPKMGQFREALSIGDILYAGYGKVGKIGGGIFSLLFCMGLVGAQVGAIGYIFEVLLDIPRFWGVIIGFGIILVYVTIGGIRAVIITDIIQFLIIAIGLPLTLIYGIWQLGGVESMLAHIPADHLTLLGSMSVVGFVSLFLSFLFGETLVPPYVQRLLIAKSTAHAARGTLWSGIFSIPFFVLTGLIGLVALGLEPNLNANLAMPYTVSEVLPIGIKGLVVAAIISITMSSADSFLNSAGVALTHDIIVVLKKKQLSERQKLRWARIGTFVIGLFAVFFALKVESVLDALLLAYNFWAPTVLPLIVAAIYGFRASSRVFVFSAAAGILGMLCWQYLLDNPWGLNSLIVGVFSNVAVLTLCIYLNGDEENVRARAC